MSYQSMTRPPMTAYNWSPSYAYPRQIFTDICELMPDEMFTISKGICPDCGDTLVFGPYGQLVACPDTPVCGSVFRLVESPYNITSYPIRTRIPKFRESWPKESTLAAIKKANNNQEQQEKLNI